jgi:hypothetical protein
MVIATRRKLVKAAKALRDQGIAPPASQDPAAYRKRSCSAILPSDVYWKDALYDWHFARTKELPADAIRSQSLATPAGRG